MGKAALVALALLAAVAAALAQKTDVIVLSNGDRVTGEIKSYASGRLTVDTSHSSWIKVKWSLIESITSDKQFDIETIDGVHHYGALAPSEPPGQLTIVSGPQTITIGFFDVFEHRARLPDVLEALGGLPRRSASTTRSRTTSIQFNFDFDGTYRMRESQFVVGPLGLLQPAERRDVGLARLLRARCTTGFSGSTGWPRRCVGLDRNVQLGLDLRETVGVGGGRYLYRSNQAALIVLARLHRQPRDPGRRRRHQQRRSRRRGPVLVLHVRLPEDHVRRRPRRSIRASRSRAACASRSRRRVKREIVSDFYVSLSIFDSYDSRDPTTLTAKNDWGPTISIGWQF